MPYKWLWFWLLCLFARKVLSEKCYSPDNQEGRCVPMLACPEMLEEFANPKIKFIDYLKKFICGNDESGMKVCCGVSVKYPNIPEKDSVPHISNELFFGDALDCDSRTYFSEYEFVPPSLPEIRAKNYSSNQQFTKCLGSLIAYRYILTAAECIPQGKERDEFKIVEVQFQVGNKTNREFKRFSIEEEIPHPFYDKVTGINNIALLRINHTISDNGEIRSACLYKLQNPPNFGVATVTFINLHDGNAKGTLTKLIPNQDCKFSLESKNIHNNLTMYDICITGIEHPTSTSPGSYVGAPAFTVLNARLLTSFSDHFDVSSYQNFIDLHKKEKSNKTNFKDTDEDKDIYDDENNYKDDENYEDADDEEDVDDLLPTFNLHLVGLSSSRTIYGNISTMYTNVSAYFDWLVDSMRPWPIYNEHCTSPSGEVGSCVALIYCPPLMKAFSNPKKGSIAYLRKFICTTYKASYLSNIFVCCNPTLNITYFENEYYSHSDYSSLEFDFFDLKRCGMQHRDDYFSSDENISIDDFPWVASILQKHNRINPLSSGSSGSLINARYVITKTHWDERKDLVVRLGDFNRLNTTDCVEEPELFATDCSDYVDFNIEEIINHPFYDFNHKVNDIALMRLTGTVLYTDYIRPICLPRPGTITAVPGDAVYLSSWGWTSVAYNTILKKKISNQLITNPQCKQRFRHSYKSEFVSGLTRCTLYSKTNGTLACGNDDGGSLMFNNSYQWHIEGILINFFRDNCNRDAPLVYTSVSQYFYWIVDNMRPW